MRATFSAIFSVLVIGSSLAISPAFAQGGDDKYKPTVGQAGKDVIWVPTPDEMLTAMLNAANVTSQDLVYDLGAGDGKIAIAAARQFGATAVGIEYGKEMAELATRNADRAGVSGKVTIIQGDIFKVDFSKATVVTMYLLPELNMRLKSLLKKMPPGTRIVSHSFGMETWEPDLRINTSVASGFLWIVPAQVAGQWSIEIAGLQQPAVLTLSQSHQILTGSLVLDGKKVQIEEARMRGSEIRFQVKGLAGEVLMFEGQVAGNQLSGRMQPAATPTPIKGLRTVIRPS